MLKLLCHPECGATAIDGVMACIIPAGRGRVEICYLVRANPGILKWPEYPSERRDGLWKSTCFEAFIRNEDARAQSYVEYNFSPNGAWAAYHFDGYRDGMQNLELVSSPDMDFAERPDGYSVRILLQIPEYFRTGRLSCNLTAILEENGGGKSYWALRHAPAAPDFHNADCFTHKFRADENS